LEIKIMTSLADRYKQITPTTESGYRSNDPSVRSYGNRVGYIRGDVKIFKPVVDVKQCVRFFPYKGFCTEQVLVHSNIGADGHAVPCLKTKQQACPLCDLGKKIFLEEGKEASKPYWSKTRWLAWIVDRNAESEGPQLFDMANRSMERLRGLMQDQESGAIVCIDDLATGRDVYFEKGKEDSKATMNTIQFLQIGSKEKPMTVGDKPIPSDANLMMVENSLSKRTWGWYQYVYGEGFLEDVIVYQTPAEMLRLAGVPEHIPGIAATEQSVTLTAPTPTRLITNTMPCADLEEPKPETEKPEELVAVGASAAPASEFVDKMDTIKAKIAAARAAKEAAK
jgi:hypothetical protein